MPHGGVVAYFVLGERTAVFTAKAVPEWSRGVKASLRDAPDTGFVVADLVGDAVRETSWQGTALVGVTDDDCLPRSSGSRDALN